MDRLPNNATSFGHDKEHEIENFEARRGNIVGIRYTFVVNLSEILMI